MNRLNLIPTLAVLGMVLLNPISAFAHVALTHSMPGAESTVNVAPESLMLEFTEDVRLLKAAIAPQDGKELDIGFKPVAAAAKHFNVALPALGQGVYQVNWTVMGSDGHRMDESFSFTIDANAMGAGHEAEHGASQATHADSHAGHGDSNADNSDGHH